MKEYPSIPRLTNPDSMSVYAFGKLDGSCVRAEWSPKKGFYKFGSRTRLLGDDQGFLAEAKDLILSKYAPLDIIFSKQKYENAVAFFEFYGPNSFAGTHQAEPHDVVLFDVAPYKKGILPPKEYIDLFGELSIAPLLYHGPASAVLIELVKTSNLEDMPFEGVVCKAKNPKKTLMPVMFKIKSDAWLSKLKNYCGDDIKKFEALK